MEQSLLPATGTGAVAEASHVEAHSTSPVHATNSWHQGVKHLPYVY